MRMQGHFGRNKKRYGFGLAGAAALAAPFAFQRFRGTANALRKMIFTKAGRSAMQSTKGVKGGAGYFSQLGSAAKANWAGYKGGGLFRRTQGFQYPAPASTYVAPNPAGRVAKRAAKPAAKKTTRRRR